MQGVLSEMQEVLYSMQGVLCWMQKRLKRMQSVLCSTQRVLYGMQEVAVQDAGNAEASGMAPPRWWST